DVPESAGQLMASLPQDVVVREQYMDFFKNRMFRQTLICHEAAPVNRTLDETSIEGLWISSRARPGQGADGKGEEEHAAGETRAMVHATMPGESPGARTFLDPEALTFLTPEGFSMTTSEPLVQATMMALGDAWPRSLEFPALLARAREAAGPEVPAELVAAR